MKAMHKFRANEHKNHTDCQVFIALTGDSKNIKEQLLKIVNDIDKYGKPMQGITQTYKCVKEVITPVWNSKEY